MKKKALITLVAGALLLVPIAQVLGQLAQKDLPPSINLLLLLAGKAGVSGLVWHDEDGNGTRNGAEAGVANVMVYLDINRNGLRDVAEPAAITGSQGDYGLANLRPGSYSVRIDTATIPAGFGFTTAHPLAITLSHRQNYIHADFGIQDKSGGVAGSIWNDSDKDGIFDASENPIPGVNVYADLNQDDAYTFGEPYGTSGSQGKYAIRNLGAGTYRIHVDNGTLPVIYSRTPVSGTNPVTVILTAGQTRTARFGYQQKVAISGVLLDTSGATWAKVTLYLDLNNNGIWDEGEPITVTDDYGNYIFDGLLPGTYTVRILTGALNPGYDIILAPQSVTLGEGQSVTTAHFLADAQPTVISSSVWDDANGNRVIDPDEEGLPGVTVFLDNNNNGIIDAGEQTSVTDSQGLYTLSATMQIFYFIRVDESTLPANYVPTTENNPVYMVIGPGVNYSEARFGYQHRLAIHNEMQHPTKLVWSENNILYVSDTETNSVHIFDSGLFQTGELKGLSHPMGVGVDSGGNLYVGNQGRQNVEVYDPDGILIKTIGNGVIQQPTDIAFDNAGLVYILDQSMGGRVLAYDGLLLDKTIGTYGPAAGQFRIPVSIAVYNGELYVADVGKGTIHVFNLNGVFQRDIGQMGDYLMPETPEGDPIWDGYFAGLKGIAFDQRGNIHGVDNTLNVVQVFDPVTTAFKYSYKAYYHEDRANIQMDISIRKDNLVSIANAATVNIESVFRVP